MCLHLAADISPHTLIVPHRNFLLLVLEYIRGAILWPVSNLCSAGFCHPLWRIQAPPVQRVHTGRAKDCASVSVILKGALYWFGDKIMPGKKIWLYYKPTLQAVWCAHFLFRLQAWQCSLHYYCHRVSLGGLLQDLAHVEQPLWGPQIALQTEVQNLLKKVSNINPILALANLMSRETKGPYGGDAEHLQLELMSGGDVGMWCLWRTGIPSGICLKVNKRINGKPWLPALSSDQWITAE